VLTNDYIAGLFDGEGYFTMRRVKGGSVRTVREWRFQCYAHIVMRELWVLEDIVSSLGYGWARPYSCATDIHSSYGYLGITGDGLFKFCDDIGPLLRLKRRQASLVKEVCVMKRRTRNQPIADADYDRQVGIWEELRELNKRGCDKPREAQSHAA